MCSYFSFTDWLQSIGPIGLCVCDKLTRINVDQTIAASKPFGPPTLF